ncbi:HNH homing endonuclease [Lactobacillus phage Ldl1]|uniref:HNH homing endonuclease n=1 Tax=Lactobacillus phage Ldl1 TaxID=1552735 RepID=A0A0A7DN25_9CAUD|nr:HNH endonuclease [Lactobacillus phage Ldl1]AIS73905.1 HNH homing endonuclease [Lactobacillus phage Ldl1]
MTNEAEEQEVWKPYPKYPFIEANQLGEIRTVDRVVTYKNGAKRFYKGKVLKQQLERNGYLRVGFGINGKVVHLLVHRIVATCFLPNPKGLEQVNHKDCDKTNNSVENLEWCSTSYNIQYREKYGKALGHPVVAINLKTLKVLFFKSQREAARQLRIFNQNINDVTKGKRRQTHDFWFCCANENAIKKVKEKFGDELASKVERIMV